MFDQTHLYTALVSASAALVIGGMVRLFGAPFVLQQISRIGSFLIRRRGVSTFILGSAATAGLATASAVGLEAQLFGDAVSWFQSHFDTVERIAEMGGVLND